MSEHDEGESEAEFVSIGERLRRAREARGMSLDDVANHTRIPMRHLQHIETGDWDALPAPTYAIGFTRNYAAAVGLDGPALASELRESIGGPRRRAPTPEYYEPADPARVPPRSLVIIAAILAVLLVGGYLIWRGTLGAGDGSTSIPVAEAPEAAPARNDSAAGALAPHSLAGQSVTLTATGDVWMRITEGAGGAQLFQGILAAGQTYAIPATAIRPVIRTGRPHLVRASAGGRDLGPLAPEERLIENFSLLAQDVAARAPNAPARPPASTDAPLPAPIP
jgi:transcriptional regulator with XRE-family HTH domain